jgi:hypothetical protein
MTTSIRDTKRDLADFIDAVEKERPNRMFVSGLVIRKSVTSPTVEEIARGTPGAVIVEIAKGVADSDVLNTFREAFEKNKWLVVHLSDGSLPSLWREQLSRLRDSNTVFIQGKTAEDTFFAEQSEDMRVLAVIDDQHVDAVEYPTFLNLFGPVTEV